MRPTQLKVVSSSPVGNPLSQWLLRIYTDALRRMNIEMVYVDVPPKRASYYSDNGIADAELSRVASYYQLHPDMVRVEEHSFIVSFMAYGIDSNIVLQGWDSLKGTNYKVDYRLGIMRSEQQLKHVVALDDLNATTDVHMSLKRLLMGRTDVYVDTQDFVESVLKTDAFHQLSEGQAIYHLGLMEQTTGHVFLHKKHSELAPELSSVINAMKREGLFTQYMHEVGLTELELSW